MVHQPSQALVLSPRLLPSSPPPPPPSPSEAAAARSDDATLMRQLAPHFEQPLQLAREHIAGLPSAPWPDRATLGDEAAARLERTQQLLRAHAAPLAAEYRALRDAGALISDEDCIAARTAERPWRRYVGAASPCLAPCALPCSNTVRPPPQL